MTACIRWSQSSDSYEKFDGGFVLLGLELEMLGVSPKDRDDDFEEILSILLFMHFIAEMPPSYF